MTTCKFPGCALTPYKVGFCNAHYIRQRRGRPMNAPVRRVAADPNRFWDKVEKCDGCWNWTAFIGPDGYGRFMINQVPHLAHRVSFQRSFGEIPAGMEIDHICHNRICVNPTHLRIATHAQNNQNPQGARRDSRSGIRGVRQTPSGRWAAQVQLLGEKYHLGTFNSAEEAHLTVVQWRRVHMPYSVMDQNRAGA